MIDCRHVRLTERSLIGGCVKSVCETAFGYSLFSTDFCQVLFVKVLRMFCKSATRRTVSQNTLCKCKKKLMPETSNKYFKPIYWNFPYTAPWCRSFINFQTIFWTSYPQVVIRGLWRWISYTLQYTSFGMKCIAVYLYTIFTCKWKRNVTSGREKTFFLRLETIRLNAADKRVCPHGTFSRSTEICKDASETLWNWTPVKSISYTL